MPDRGRPPIRPVKFVSFEQNDRSGAANWSLIGQLQAYDRQYWSEQSRRSTLYTRRYRSSSFESGVADTGDIEIALAGAGSTTPEKGTSHD
ncbi:MAG: hypothetical protein ACLPPV_00925 [Candidatus Korobacteraceae bacterium]